MVTKARGGAAADLHPRKQQSEVPRARPAAKREPGEPRWPARATGLRGATPPPPWHLGRRLETTSLLGPRCPPSHTGLPCAGCQAPACQPPPQSSTSTRCAPTASWAGTQQGRTEIQSPAQPRLVTRPTETCWLPKVGGPLSLTQMGHLQTPVSFRCYLTCVAHPFPHHINWRLPLNVQGRCHATTPSWAPIHTGPPQGRATL